ncbi:MAG: NADH-quinone oxidoreductase subunit J [Pyrinomonadaceae bacterium MAG19_C2-C3]|nr:NADH-quinone oxidoreductase subunit J [Pyrinomonadaceae bacterium MAG19_C2-C3]
MIIADLFQTLIWIVLAGLAIGSGVAMVVQRNPLYAAISLIGVFISFAGFYLLLGAPFIAAVQVIVYAGAIMVLVVFVIMLLNVEEEVRKPLRLKFLIPAAIFGAAILFAQAAFIIYSVGASPVRVPNADAANSQIGLTKSIGTGLFTDYLLPFEITSILILMAIVGAITLARRPTVLLLVEEDYDGKKHVERRTLKIDNI